MELGGVIGHGMGYCVVGVLWRSCGGIVGVLWGLVQHCRAFWGGVVGSLVGHCRVLWGCWGVRVL